MTDTALRPIAVDWRALEWAVDHGAADEPCFLDTETGELADLAAEAVAALPEGEAGRFLLLEPLTAAEEITWMQELVEELDDDWPRDTLVEALLLAEAPRRAFQQALGRFPAERVRWLEARRRHLRSRLLGRLAQAGFVPEDDRQA